ncbi:MAG: hypothetical protein JNN32_03735 [Flavobacteriales bacterium]|nr:hypothetical protein [Flavobacteriales bacterium]
MRHTNLLILIVSIATLSACAKAGKEVAEELGLAPASCGTDGARVEVDFDGSSFCADGSIVAVSDGTSASITGIGLLGNTFSAQVDSIALGQHTVSEASNALLFMSTGTPYVSVGDSAGWLAIDEHDAANRRLKVRFQAVVFNEMNGQTKPISGSVDVTYTTAE